MGAAAAGQLPHAGHIQRPVGDRLQSVQPRQLVQQIQMPVGRGMGAHVFGLRGDRQAARDHRPGDQAHPVGAQAEPRGHVPEIAGHLAAQLAGGQQEQRLGAGVVIQRAGQAVQMLGREMAEMEQAAPAPDDRTVQPRSGPARGRRVDIGGGVVDQVSDQRRRVEIGPDGAAVGQDLMVQAAGRHDGNVVQQQGRGHGQAGRCPPPVDRRDGRSRARRRAGQPPQHRHPRLAQGVQQGGPAPDHADQPVPHIRSPRSLVRPARHSARPRDAQSPG